MNEYLYRLLTSAAPPGGSLAAVAAILGQGMPWIVVLLLGMCYLRGNPALRPALRLALLAGVTGMACGWLVLLLLPAPPVVEWQVGTVLFRRIPPNSWPAPPVILLLAVVTTLCLCRSTRRLGLGFGALALLAVIMRICGRQHLPYYFFSSLAVALPVGWLIWYIRRYLGSADAIRVEGK